MGTETELDGGDLPSLFDEEAPPLLYHALRRDAAREVIELVSEGRKVRVEPARP
jgi:hypothetical protein